LVAAAIISLPSEALAQYGHHYGHRYGHGYYGHGYGYGGHGYGYGAYSNDGRVRIEVSPKALRDVAHVYVNEAHVGVVDDFDGFFQRLVLSPGKYEIEVRLDGYHPLQMQVFVSPRSTFKIRHQLEPIVAN
ncbi:MAG: PEGA domain-containing protein, partial [Gemmatimonadales bacterium]